MYQLEPEQEEAVRKVDKHQLSLVVGQAGTGKTAIISHLKTRYQVVHCLAPTGLAANSIDGMTIHSFIYSIKSSPPTVTDLIVVDEISMVDTFLLEWLERTLKKVMKPERGRGKVFGGLRVVLLGDFCQLPPVNGNFSFNSPLWELFKNVTELKTIKRQKDPIFQEFLTRVRVGLILDEDKNIIKELLSKEYDDEDSTHLFFTNREVNDHNQQLLGSKYFTLQCKVTSYKNFDPLEIPKILDDTNILPRYLNLRTGARVMITTNINVAEGWFNGTLCDVLSLDDDSITLSRISDGEERIVVRSKYVIVKGRMKGSGKTVYVEASSNDPNVEISDYTFSVSQFPMKLAWAITIHKSQGLSVDKCTVHLPNSPYPPSLIYVALSRCRTLKGLKLLGVNFKYGDLKPSDEVMTKFLGYEASECLLCKGQYVGAYRLCSFCISAPGKYSHLTYLDFFKWRESREHSEYIGHMSRVASISDDERWIHFFKYLSSC
jgi:ATP-dependent DNA helicase PIF1